MAYVNVSQNDHLEHVSDCVPRQSFLVKEIRILQKNCYNSLKRAISLLMILKLKANTENEINRF